MSRIFISYAHEDRAEALRLHGALRQHGLEPWIDVEDLLGGQEWQAAVEGAIRLSSHFLALLSKHSLSKRGFVQRELRSAMEARRQVPPGQIYLIPIRLDECRPVQSELSDLHWIDLFPSFEEGLRRICESLRSSGLELTAEREPAGPNRFVAHTPSYRPSTLGRPSASADTVPRRPAKPIGPTRAPEQQQTVAPEATDSSDECILDEHGDCINENQKHWGSNE